MYLCKLQNILLVVFFLVDTWNLDQSEVLEIAAIAIRNSSNLGCGGERISEIFVIL